MNSKLYWTMMTFATFFLVSVAEALAKNVAWAI